MFFEAVDLYRTGVLNLFKHVTQLISRGSVAHRLYNFSNATTVVHVQSRNENNWNHFTTQRALQSMRWRRPSLLVQNQPTFTNLGPFNDRASHYSATCIFGYNSAPAAAREVFKPSTDAESLLVSIKKTFFDSCEGFAWGRLAKWGCFRFFDLLWRALDANPIGQYFVSNLFWKLENCPRR